MELRESSSVLSDLWMRFEEAVQESFVVEVLAVIRYSDVVNHDPELIGRSYVLADEALALVPGDK